MCTSHKVQTVWQSLVRLHGAGKRLHVCGGDRNVALCSTASLRSRVAHARRDQALGLETLSVVYSAPGATVRSARSASFRANGHAVRVIAESQNRKEDQL
jgi:hypothetical protein